MSVIALLLVVALWASGRQERCFDPKRRAKLTQAARMLPQRLLCLWILDVLFLSTVSGPGPPWGDVQYFVPGPPPTISPSLVSGIVWVLELLLVPLVEMMLVTMSIYVGSHGFFMLLLVLGTRSAQPIGDSEILVWAMLPFCKGTWRRLHLDARKCVRCLFFYDVI